MIIRMILLGRQKYKEKTKIGSVVTVFLLLSLTGWDLTWSTIGGAAVGVATCGVGSAISNACENVALGTILGGATSGAVSGVSFRTDKKIPPSLTGFFNIGNEITIILLPSGFLRILSGACSEHR